METNKPDVVGYINELGLDRLRSDDDCGYVQIYARQLPEHSELPKRLPPIRLSDYEALVEALEGLLSIVSDSYGVAGYHLNGDVADWDEFCEVHDAENALAVYRNKGEG